MSTTAPQALKPLYIPAMTTLKPTEHYAGGIPIRAVENGLQIIVPAYLSMALGDKIEVFCFGTVLSKTLEFASELNRDVIFTLAKGFVLDGDAADIYYEITIKNQDPEKSTPSWTLLVKLTRPGDYDDIGGDDGHSDFNFTLDRYVIDDTFTEDDVVKMRIVTYRNLTKYDRIHCRWGSQAVFHDVTPEQALDPLNHPIDIVFEHKLIKAAGDGPKVAVAFQVVDRCGNYPDERAPWSAITNVLVDMAGNRLDEPLVLVNGQPTLRIDLDQLGGNDVKVRVYTTSKDFAVGDDVLLTWIGTPAQGPQLIVGPLSMPVEFVPFQLDFTIPNEAVRAIAKGSASVGFVRRRGDDDRLSKNASVSVVGDIRELEAPSVKEVVGGTLPPETNSATVSIPWYFGRNSSDLLNLIWVAAKPGGGNEYYEDPRPVGSVPEHEPVLRSVSNANIRRFDGLSVKVYYVVTNSEAQLLSVRESLPFTMQVGVALPTFDAPEVEEASADGTLNPGNVPATGATLVLTELNTRDKDTFYFDWIGLANGGSYSDHIDLIPATAGKRVRVTVPKQYVTNNLNGTVVVKYRLQRNGETLGHSRELTLRIGVALDLKDPEIKEAVNNVLQPFAAKDTLTAIVRAFPNMVGTQVSVTWAGTPGEGSITVGPVNVTAQQDLEIPLPNSVVAFNLGNDGVKVSYVVTRNGTPEGSKELTLTVAPIANEDSNLPTPSIDGAVGNELDVTQLAEDAQLRIAKWMLQALGHCIWLRFDGTDKNGNAVEKVFWAGEAHQQAEGLVTAAQVAWLRELKDGSPLTITFKVNYDKVAHSDTAVGFPVKEYTVNAAPALEIDTTPVLLDGKHYYLAAAPYSPPFEPTGYLSPNAHLTRQAQGGRLPYEYVSSNPNVASVDSTTGHVVSTGNGIALITVRDATGDVVTYQATCQNVFELIASVATFTTLPPAVEWVTENGGNMFMWSDYKDLALKYSFQSNTTAPFFRGNKSDSQEYLCPTGQPAQWDSEPIQYGLSFRQLAGSTEPRRVIGYRPRIHSLPD